MSQLVINGQRRLSGAIHIHGSKNSVLPILAATLTAEGQSVIENCPRLLDTQAACDILTHLGCTVRRQGEATVIDSAPGPDSIPDCLMRRMRSSVMFLGAILSRNGSARIGFPGGCELGPRPIDLHIAALESLGVVFSEHGGCLNCSCPDGLHGAKITLSIPSVGATENIMMAAVKAKGETLIFNAAREPEIEDLQSFLNAMGARVSGAGTGTMSICGVDRLSGCTHRIIPDRIVAATYIAAVAAAGGRCIIKDVCPEHLAAVLHTLSETGLDLKTGPDSVIVGSDGHLSAPRMVRTAYYPGFPTDAQALLMALSTVCRGSSVFIETVFQNRFRHVSELTRMGASIRVEGRVAVVDGVEQLWGAQVEATDLRAGAGMIIAALAAQGRTVIERIEHIDRGYESPEDILSAVGADIIRL